MSTTTTKGARTTKAQLVAELEASHVAYERCSAERDSLRESLELAHIELAACITKKPAPPVYLRRRQPTPEALQRHNDYVRALNAAREMAMKTGHVVRVG